MERADAERVFALVAEIGGDLRGRIVSERWWLVWIVMGIQILVTCCLTQVLLWQGENPPFSRRVHFARKRRGPSHISTFKNAAISGNRWLLFLLARCWPNMYEEWIRWYN